MILGQANYGVTISSEGITIIVVLLVVGIASLWLKSFIAKPDTLSTRLDTLSEKTNERFNQHDLKMQNLENEIERNSEKDMEERRRMQDEISKMDVKYWSVFKDMLKK